MNFLKRTNEKDVRRHLRVGLVEDKSRNGTREPAEAEKEREASVVPVTVYKDSRTGNAGKKHVRTAADGTTVPEVLSYRTYFSFKGTPRQHCKQYKGVHP
jgi:hypothetical protein